jgi:hypothetical protein
LRILFVATFARAQQQRGQDEEAARQQQQAEDQKLLVEAAAAQARNAAPLERDAEQPQKDEEFYKYSHTIYNAAQQQQLQAQQELVHTQTPPPPLVHTQQQPVHTQQQLVPARTLQPTRNEQDDILHCHMSKDNWSENIFFKENLRGSAFSKSPLTADFLL